MIKNKESANMTVNRNGNKFKVQYVTEFTDLTLNEVQERINQLNEEINFLEFRQEEMIKTIFIRKEELKKLKLVLES